MTYQFDPILGAGRDSAVLPAAVRTALSADADAGRTALGLGTAATTAAADYATAAQGAKADSALQAATLQDAARKYNGLVYNGSGAVGDSSNFSTFVFATDDYPFSASGAFFATSPGYTVVWTNDDFLPVDTSSVYEVSADAKQIIRTAPANALYAGFVQFDFDGNGIESYHCGRYAGSDTTLAAALSVGDTTITLTDASGWAVKGNYDDSVSLYTYRDSRGVLYERAVNPYTRYVTSSGTSQFASIAGNVVTLSAPFALANPAVGSGGVWPAGTPISQTRHGSSYNYVLFAGYQPPLDRWARTVAYIGGGIDSAGEGNATYFRAGVAKVKLVFLPNLSGVAGDKVGLSNIGLYRAPLTRAMAGL